MFGNPDFDSLSRKVVRGLDNVHYDHEKVIHDLKVLIGLVKSLRDNLASSSFEKRFNVGSKGALPKAYLDLIEGLVTIKKTVEKYDSSESHFIKTLDNAIASLERFKQMWVKGDVRGHNSLIQQVHTVSHGVVPHFDAFAKHLQEHVDELRRHQI